MPQVQHPAVALAFVVFILWLLFPGGDYQAQSLTLSDLATERLARFRDALDVLNTSRWGDFKPRFHAKVDDAEARYLNLSGFREGDGFAWEDLERFRKRSLSLATTPFRPLEDRACGISGKEMPSGRIRQEQSTENGFGGEGTVSKGYDSYNLTRNEPSMDWFADEFEWARNVTGYSGRMMLRIEGNKTVTEYEQLSDEITPVAGGQVRNIRATVTIEDTAGSGHAWEMRLWGVHWPHQGVMMLTTTSEKFEGIFGLPHLTPSEDFFQSSQKLLNMTIANTIATKQDNIYVDQAMPWSSDLDNPMYTMNPAPHCEFVMYVQVHPPSRQRLHMGYDVSDRDELAEAISAIESELQTPLGAPVPRVPKLEMSAVIYSPDCAFFLESRGPPDYPPGQAHHLVGRKTEDHVYEIKTWVLAYALVIFGQVHLLKSQMRESCTPSTMGRISFWTTSIMVIVDGMAFTAAWTWVFSATATFLPTMALLFSAFLSMTIGGSFLARIHEVQIPETRPRREREQTSSSSSVASDITNQTAASTATPAPSFAAPTPNVRAPLLPAPVTAVQPRGRPPVQPIIIPSDQDVDAEIAEVEANATGSNNAQETPSSPESPQSFQAIIGRYILFAICFIFLAVSSTTWYPSLRILFLNLCAFAYLSLWVPQIYRNTLRNCRRALSWSFVIGQSVLRLLPIAYFWTKHDNFLYARTDRRAFVVLCAWLWFQLVILAAQDIVGPRFGIPDGWTPDAWDYHPVLRDDTLEAGGLPIGLVADDLSSPLTPRSVDDRSKKRSSTRAIDCAICREVLEVPVVSAGDDDAGVAGVFARRMYMVTPCRHIFHSACLEGWMRFRLQCPICREELPPL